MLEKVHLQVIGGDDQNIVEGEGRRAAIPNDLLRQQRLDELGNRLRLRWPLHPPKHRRPPDRSTRPQRPQRPDLPRTAIVLADTVLGDFCGGAFGGMDFAEKVSVTMRRQGKKERRLCILRDIGALFDVDSTSIRRRRYIPQPRVAQRTLGHDDATHAYPEGVSHKSMTIV